MRTSASHRSHDEGAWAVIVAGEPSEATMILLAHLFPDGVDRILLRLLLLLQ